MASTEPSTDMTISKPPRGPVRVTELGLFLREPPPGFSVETHGSVCRVHSDPESSVVLIGDCESHGARIQFHESQGRKIKVHNLWDYTSVRKSLLSKRIYLLASSTSGAASKQYVVSIEGADPFIRWQMEKGLDWTISSVAGESYRVDIDLTEALESWAAKHTAGEEPSEVKPVWTDASFTLKYYSDALFDFPHWFGFSKRKFKLRLT